MRRVMLSYTSRERGNDVSFFEYLSQFCFLSIEFYCTYSISYKILPYFVYYYCILVRVRYSVGTSFVRVRFASFHTQASLLTIFVCLLSWISGRVCYMFRIVASIELSLNMLMCDE